MRHLVIGGSASGKSEYAEGLLSRFEKKIYLATMLSDGAEAARRIEKHRAARENSGFITVERGRDIKSMDEKTLPRGIPVLLECLGNLAANELFSPNGENALREILAGVELLEERSGYLVVVTNDIFSDGCGYDEYTLKYIKLLAKCNSILAARFEAVTEVVCGMAIKHKEAGM